MTFEQIRQYIKGVINGIDFNSHISPMPAEDMSEIITPLPSVMSRRFKYSTEEQIVGEWIDGKPIYQRTIDCGTLPNVNYKIVPHSISDFDFPIKIFGVGYASDGSNILLPFIDGANSSTVRRTNISVNRTEIFIDARTMDASKYTSSYVTFQYTKTTD